MHSNLSADENGARKPIRNSQDVEALFGGAQWNVAAPQKTIPTIHIDVVGHVDASPPTPTAPIAADAAIADETPTLNAAMASLSTGSSASCCICDKYKSKEQLRLGIAMVTKFGAHLESLMDEAQKEAAIDANKPIADVD